MVALTVVLLYIWMLLYMQSAGPCPKTVGAAEIQIINGSCDSTGAALLSMSEPYSLLDVSAVVVISTTPSLF